MGAAGADDKLSRPEAPPPALDSGTRRQQPLNANQGLGSEEMVSLQEAMIPQRQAEALESIAKSLEAIRELLEKQWSATQPHQSS